MKKILVMVYENYLNVVIICILYMEENKKLIYMKLCIILKLKIGDY